MMKMKIKLDEAGIRADGLYDIGNLWKEIDKFFAKACTKEEMPDGSVVYRGIPDRDYYTDINVAVMVLDDIDWFAQYCVKWIWYDNDDDESLPFEEEDVLAYKRTNNPLFIKWSKINEQKRKIVSKPLEIRFKGNVEEKFLRYVRVDTPSNEDNYDITPSTECQKKLARMLCEELCALGLEAEVTDNAYVYSCIPANCSAKHSIGFIAHIDTVDKPSGLGVKPMVHKSYSGGDIPLSTGKISVSDFPELDGLIGQDIITSDGTTVLGADDKAGVAEIMALAEYLVTHPEVKHGKIGIAFTPDEEIGHGAKLFDVEKFGCDFAYTVDGEELGEITYETFNGACFDLEISGVNIHPGQAKGKMVNAVCIANEFINSLPASERPETTEGREGYYFVTEIAGGVESCAVHGIIRDHDKTEFLRRKGFVKAQVDRLNGKYGEKIAFKMRDQYYNCAEVILPHKHLIDNAEAAMEEAGVKPLIFPIRGGTDGSSLSFMGLPCPNICAGGRNAHGLNEYVSVQAMQKVVEILLGIVAAYAK